MQVAVDASVLVALLNPRDIWRDQSIALEHALLEAGNTPVYFDCVAMEAVSAAARRLREKGRAAEVPALIDRLNDRVPHENLAWVLPDVLVLYPEALEIMRASSGELNFNHALIANETCFAPAASARFWSSPASTPISTG
jgi:hypothetical protein